MCYSREEVFPDGLVGVVLRMAGPDGVLAGPEGAGAAGEDGSVVAGPNGAVVAGEGGPEPAEAAGAEPAGAGVAGLDILVAGLFGVVAGPGGVVAGPDEEEDFLELPTPPKRLGRSSRPLCPGAWRGG